MKKIALLAVLSLFVTAAFAADSTNAPTSAKRYGTWGVDLEGMDRSVKPGDDFFRYVNGHWAATTQIPPDKIATFYDVVSRVANDLKTKPIAADELKFYCDYFSRAEVWALPDDMRVYCAHEYTQSNARFAVTIETDNKKLLDRSAAIDAARSRGEATVPSLLGEEKATNPFLRADVPAVQRAVGMTGGDPVAVFAEVRHRKDIFR